jgi:hypothetical protein
VTPQASIIAPSAVGPCEIWQGTLCSNGYARLGRDPVYYRTLYIRHVGPVPAGYEIDHLCRNRACVNVAHMEAVPKRVNILRGESFSAQNYRKTHCVRGHLFDEANTYRRGSRRQCRACNRAAVDRYQMKNPRSFA